MSASQSNLSNSSNPYDLVVAVTQSAINATMKQFLAGVSAPEIISCWVYDANNNFVAIDFDTLLTDAKGSNPFNVPAGSDPTTNPDLVNLTQANFAGAFKAMIGLPDMPIASMPPVVTLGNGTNAPVLFNLLCQEFQITGFDYGRVSTWINASPVGPQGTPVYFAANVNIDAMPIDQGSPVPVAVQQQINQLMEQVGPQAFSIQQLFLDLDTAILESAPIVAGIPSTWAMTALINSTFVSSYFAACQKTGQPVLSYTLAVTEPGMMTMQLGPISHECCALLNNGQPIPAPTPAQLNATTFVYLGSSASTPPTPEPFPWNWVELGDVTAFSGVMAVRRDIFLDFVAGVVNEGTGPLTQVTWVSLTHSGDDYSVSYGSSAAATAAQFNQVSPIGAPGADGFTKTHSLNYEINGPQQTDSSEAEDHLSSIYGDFSYGLTGEIAVNGNQIRIKITPVGTMDFYHHELGVPYTDLPSASYYDKTMTALYVLGVNQQGELVVTQSNTIVDSSATWNFNAEGILGTFGFESNVQTGLTQLDTNLSSALDSALANFATGVASAINGYQAWVFPGAGTFILNNVEFSTGLDLITTLVYANPN